jgi:hypothetical protein
MNTTPVQSGFVSNATLTQILQTTQPSRHKI